MEKIRDALGLNMEREGLKLSTGEVNFEMEKVKVFNYEDALNIAMRTLEKLY